MERLIERGGGSWYVHLQDTRDYGQLLILYSAGPAHAVYFATYEVVKQAMGGNAAGHHPLAAGKTF
jgi:hypothetical protein